MNKRVLVIVILILVLVLGVVAAVYLLRQQQDIREKASVPGGTSTVTVSPDTSTISIGESTRVSVLFNTGGLSISGIAAKLNYTYSEVSAPVDVQNITISSGLLGTGEWTCPVTQFNASAGIATIDISCCNTSTTGYSTEVDTQLATFDLVAASAPEINPVVLAFAPNNSIIAAKETGEDVLLTPSTTGTYRVLGVGGVGSTSSATGSGTGTASPTGSGKATATSKATGSATPRATGSGTPVAVLPNAGIVAPTMMGVSVGVVLIIGALLLAI